MFSEVVVRMPPSPTGSLHLGTARTALFNYLFAKHYKGKIIFRWEDTDRERSQKKFEKEILEGLKWLGMDFEKESEKIFRQTENESLHKEWLEKLWQENKIFPCFTSPEEIEIQRQEATKKHTNFVFWSPFRETEKLELEKKMKKGDSFVWRLRTPKNQEVVFGDLIRGRISVNSDTLGDFAIARSDGSVLYLLANVVDDAEQGVTHVLRGEDHISNTPKQILLYQVIEKPEPYFGHIPLVLDNQKRKLSKRNVQPGVCVLINDFQTAGFVPEAVVNGLALLGWNPKTTKEFFSLEELIPIFDLKKVNPGSAQYNFEKMQWFNAQWIRELPIETLIQHFNIFAGTNYDSKDINLFSYIREKARSLEDFSPHIKYISEDPDFDSTLLPHEKMQIDIPLAKKMLGEIQIMLEKIQEKDWNRETIQQKSTEYIESLKVKNGQFLHPFRIALSNRQVSLGPFEIAELLGKQKTLRRIERAKTN